MVQVGGGSVRGAIPLRGGAGDGKQGDAHAAGAREIASCCRPSMGDLRHKKYGNVVQSGYAARLTKSHKKFFLKVRDRQTLERHVCVCVVSEPRVICRTKNSTA